MFEVYTFLYCNHASLGVCMKLTNLGNLSQYAIVFFGLYAMTVQVSGSVAENCVGKNKAIFFFFLKSGSFMNSFETEGNL